MTNAHSKDSSTKQDPAQYLGQDYDRAKLPPATPPTIDPHADPVEARELANDNGDSDFPGKVPAEQPIPDGGDTIAPNAPDEVREPAPDHIDPGQTPDEVSPDRLDGAGEQAHDATVPLTQLPPD